MTVRKSDTVAGDAVKVPRWAVSPLVTVLMALMALAGSFAIMKKHAEDEDKHVNAPLIEYRLEQIERSVGEIKVMLERPR